MGKSLTDKTISGLNWNFLNNYSNAIVTTVVGIILARLLTPQDFGLIGMVLIFTGLADLFASLGMGQAVIRIKDLSENHIRVATTLTIISSVLIYFIFYFLSPLIADFYRESRLISIIKVLSLLFIIRGLNTVSYGRLQKDLDFKSVMVISIGSTMAYGLTSSMLAFMGFEVWSLVYGKIISASFACILTLKKYPVNLKFLIKKKEFKDMAGFGSGVSLSNILLYGSSNIDYLLIGKFINPYSLGLYTRAFNLMTQSISKVTGGMYNVLFPAFAAAQDDKQKLRTAYLRTVKTVSYFIFPILAIMILNADYVIKGLYGDKWSGAITVFQILAFGGILRATLPYSGAIAHATGRVYAEVTQQLVYFLVLGLSAFFLLRFGIEGVAFAVVIALLWMFIAQSWLAIKIIESSWKDFVKSIKPGIANLAAAVLINLLFLYVINNYFKSLGDEIRLLFAVVLNAAAFLLIIIFMPASLKGDSFEWLVEKYKKYIPNFFIKIYYSFNSESR